jgi:phage tail tape-measure protein
MDIKSKATKGVSGLIMGTALVSLLVAGCAGGPLTTREKGAGIGALGGAAAGGLIGSAVHHPALGAAIGGGLGLGAGALIGDQLQGRENQAAQQDEQIYQNQQELQRQRDQLNALKRNSQEY